MYYVCHSSILPECNSSRTRYRMQSVTSPIQCSTCWTEFRDTSRRQFGAAATDGEQQKFERDLSQLRSRIWNASNWSRKPRLESLNLISTVDNRRQLVNTRTWIKLIYILQTERCGWQYLSRVRMHIALEKATNFIGSAIPQYNLHRR